MSQTPIDYPRLAVMANMIAADLRAADALLVAGAPSRDLWLLVVKAALLACSNLADLELAIRPLYRDHRDLSASFTAVRDELALARYLRNIFVGHINGELVDKTIEWRPESRQIAIDGEVMSGALLNLFALETAINSYVAPDGGHRLSTSETDLVYPPDWQRFIDYLEKTIRGSLAFLERLLAILAPSVPTWSDHAEMFELYRRAGETDFRYIKRSR